jgi:hypothetical protein
MARLFSLFLLLLTIRGNCQERDILGQRKDSISNNAILQVNKKAEILTSGFIDLVSNGQVNASARFMRLYIGEPGKFVIPLCIYTGVSSNNFQGQQIGGSVRNNEQLVNNLINPLGGLANISIEGILFLKHNRSSMTATGILYHGGLRVLTGYKTGLITDPSTGRPINFLNSFGTGGLYFQTGAWERNNSKNIGVCWVAGRYIICKSGSGQLKNIMSNIQTSGFYHGWSAAWGVEINDIVNIKVIYYKYVKAPELDFSQPIYQFSFNYSLK